MTESVPARSGDDTVLPSDVESLRPVTARFVFLYAFAYAGVWLALLTPMLVTIALRVRELAPHHAAGVLALTLGVGAFFAMVGNPVFGRLSDRTISRFGMRRPWLVGGMLLGTASLAIIARAPDIPMLLFGWCLAQLAFNAVLAAIVAVLPDHVPAVQQGTVAGVLGMCMPIGQAGGTFLVQALPDSILLRFLVPACVGLVAVLLFAVLLPDRRLSRPHGTAPPPISSWLDPFRHPDFLWAWLSRFLLVMGTAFLTTYQSYYLIDKLGYAMSKIPALVFKGMLLQGVLIIVSSLISGRASDVTGRRKAFVMGSAAIYAVGLWSMAAAVDETLYLVGMALTGMGQGAFFAVELALVTQILPDRIRHAARDLGLFNIANTLPQVVAPALGPLILAASADDYTWVFIVAGCSALFASFAIAPLRGVR
jgi:MFS family permease